MRASYALRAARHAERLQSHQLHGIQPLYFKDPELLRRAQIPADSAQRMEVRIA